MKKKYINPLFSILITILHLVNCSIIVAQNTTLDLSGIWQFQIDRNDVGVKEQWFSKKLVDKITLPGSMNENRKGDDVTLHTQWTASIYDSSFFYNPRLEKYRDPDNLKLPFWLTPVKYYVGVAWYQKEVTIPANWKGKRIVLFLERPHIETRVWANNKEIGMQNSLSVPHVYDLTSYLKPGKNTLSVRVDNRIKDIDVGKDSHSITDQTQGNWNGIVGRIELQSTPKSYIDDIQVFPDVKNKKALVKLSLRGNSSGILTLEANSFNSDTLHSVVPVIRNYKIDKDSLRLDVELPMGKEMQTWDEFHPTLYRLKITMKSGKNETDVKETYFGMRDFTIKDTYFYVNDRKIVLRGTVENCVFPLTGYPAMDVESWERIFRICRNFGLNHMRFHSYCPPKAAFIAADLVGFYLQPEGPSWPNHGSSLGDGRPVDKYLEEEAKRIVKDYGNHPSFCMFAIGNEPRGRWVPWVSRFVDYWKAADPRRVYTGASVGNSWAWQPKSQFHVKAGARGLAWDRRPETNSDYLANIDTVKQPYVAHEMGQWCVFPDFTEIRKYTGVMKARNFELFQEDLFDRGMGTLAPDFLRASGKLQALCYKHEIEKMLRTPKYAGFQLLSLNDYSGQGTALVGLLNAFWEEKGYITAKEFRHFCAPTVLLSRMDKFVFKNNETFKARVEVAHFGEHPLKNMKAVWRIRDPYGKIISKGSLSEKDITIGNCQSLGEVSYPLHGLTKAQKLNFEVKFQGTDITNNWDFWVYPETLPEVDTSSIYICTQIDNTARSVLDKGGSVLLQLAGKVTQGSDVVQYMTPVFWNTSWFKMRPPHTVGTLINDYHPVFKDFPTDFYTGLQWWELIHKAQVMELTDFPKSFQPIVQPIDTWFINRKLGMLFEAKAGNGKIVVCSADIQNNLEERPVARQLRYSILKYMNSHLFHPENDIDLSLIENLYTKQGERLEVTTQDAPDELKKNVKP
ncbi:MAG TPA: glycoside hydrolase family 2 TIM barrel-domain containing protein [Dysgonamonadaceae bacterium]|nr:glycoside hydrolase family 2 TIM barrel-domain containing protein [Dysgonamonadaceae bacterium]